MNSSNDPLSHSFNITEIIYSFIFLLIKNDTVQQKVLVDEHKFISWQI